MESMEMAGDAVRGQTSLSEVGGVSTVAQNSTRSYVPNRKKRTVWSTHYQPHVVLVCVPIWRTSTARSTRDREAGEHGQAIFDDAGANAGPCSLSPSLRGW